MSTDTYMTAEQLLRMPDDGLRCELIAGELRMMSPASSAHGFVTGRLHGLLFQYAEATGAGHVFSAETGFLLARNPDTVRAPDVAFISKERMPREMPAEAYWPLAPDLAVEVLSPDDKNRAVGEKIQAWLDAGCRAVWVVDPKARTITVHRPATDAMTLTQNDELSGGDAVPGFLCRVAEVFGRV